MEQTTTKIKRELLTKRPFYRINADVGKRMVKHRTDVGEQTIPSDQLQYDIATQEDFMRELDPNAHAINDRTIYQNWIQQDENGLYYETDFERHAFAFQRNILEDRLVRLTGNDIQFDLTDRNEVEETRLTFYKFRSTWAEKSMERAWYQIAKSTLSTGDAAFVGILSQGKFCWKTFSFENGDVLYPHYDRQTGKLSVFARSYKDFDDEGEVRHYVDVWDDRYYYRFIKEAGYDDFSGEKVDNVQGFSVTGYYMQEKSTHGFERIPVAYKRCETGPCWSASQEVIEHYEAAFSRLAQSNTAFGLPILSLTAGAGSGKKIEELATSDMSYAAKVFIVPHEGKAEFLQRQDASNAYKAQLDELRRSIYELSMVSEDPQLKSGDTPAAAIKLLYSKSYNKAMNETQEFDEVIDDMVEIFRWGAGIECNCRLDFIKLPMAHWTTPFLPISENELTTILATGVQNGFCSKQTASEKFPYATPQEWSRILAEKEDEQHNELLLEEQKLDIQNDAQVELQEDLSDIQVEQQAEIAENNVTIQSSDSSGNKRGARKARLKKGSGSSGRPGRPNASGARWDRNGNEINPLTGKAYSKLDRWNETH